MWYCWVWWLMSAEDAWLDEMGEPEYKVWHSVNWCWYDFDKEYLWNA